MLAQEQLIVNNYLSIIDITRVKKGRGNAAPQNVGTI